MRTMIDSHRVGVETRYGDNVDASQGWPYAHRMLPPNIVACTVLILASVVGVGAAAKPKLKVADDGFPTGQNTPEGAASDLVRAFMQSNVTLLQSVCIRPYGAGQSRSDYSGYLAGVVAHLKRQQERHTPSPDGPSRITKVFAARHLSNNGPASYGNATFDFQDVMFVDVEVLLGSGKQHLRRTLVIKDRDGKWYVHPFPDVSPLLSSGLYDESPSLHLFAEAYTVEK